MDENIPHQRVNVNTRCAFSRLQRIAAAERADSEWVESRTEIQQAVGIGWLVREAEQRLGGSRHIGEGITRQQQHRCTNCPRVDL